VDSTITRQARVDLTKSLTVTTRPAGSTTWYYEIRGPGFITLFTPPAGRTKLAISTLTYANPDDFRNHSDLIVYPTPDCSGGFLDSVERVMVPPFDTVTISFPQPLLIGPGGSNWCLAAGLDNHLVLTATGYYY